MLHHISIAVDHPAHVAEVLAKIFAGRCFPFPVHENSYIALAGDEYGTAVEVLPAGTHLTPGLEEVDFSPTGSTTTFSAVHAAMSVPTSLQELKAIGSAEGWLVRLCDRGPFKVIEFWVENKFPFEFLPPDLTEAYLSFLTIASYEAFMKQMMAAQPA